MRQGWIRNEPEPRTSAVAGLLALGAGVAVAGVTFYLTRLLLSREPLPLRPGPADRALGPGEPEREAPG